MNVIGKLILDLMSFNDPIGVVLKVLGVVGLFFFVRSPIIRFLWRRVLNLLEPIWQKVRPILEKWKVLEPSPIEHLHKRREIIRLYFHAWLQHCADFGDVRFDTKKDYVENSKQILEDQSMRFYGLRHKSLRHDQVIKLLMTTAKGNGAVKPFAIVGDAACGKTVEMMKIFAVLAKEWVAGTRLPILVFVNSLDETARSQLVRWTPAAPLVDLKAICCSYLRTLQKPTLPDGFVDLLESHWDVFAPIILFDAIDECPERQHYSNMLGALAAAGEKASPATVVVSCREKEFAAGKQFVKIKILDLTPEQVVLHFQRYQEKWPLQSQQLLSSVEIRREMSPTHSMGNYLRSPYFLSLYLRALVNRPSPNSPVPTSLSDLFSRLFAREVNKHSGLGSVIDRNLPYFEDVLAKVGMCMTNNVLKASASGSGEVAISSEAFLQALLERPNKENGDDWRGLVGQLWAEVASPGSAGLETASRITGMLGTASDVKFAAFVGEFTSRVRNDEEPAHLVSFTLHWIQEFGFPLQTNGRESKPFEDAVARVLAAQPRGERACAAAILALGFRPIGWAITGGIVRYDPEAGTLLRFAHQRIREYLTAKYIEEAGFNSFLQGAAVQNAWWRETLNMLAGITKSPCAMLAATLGSKPEAGGENAAPDPWRVLVAAECTEFLSGPDREACQSMVGHIHDRLKRLAFEPIGRGHPIEYQTFQIWAVDAVGKMMAGGVLKGTGCLTGPLHEALRNSATEKAALDAMVALLRTTRMPLAHRLSALSGVLYGLLSRDPEIRVGRIISSVPSKSRVLLEWCCLSGPIIRFLAWLVYVSCCIGCIMWALLSLPDTSGEWLLYGLAIVGLGWLLRDWTGNARSMADSIYRCAVRWPWRCVAGCWTFGCTVLEQAFDALANLAKGVCAGVGELAEALVECAEIVVNFVRKFPGRAVAAGRSIGNNLKRFFLDDVLAFLRRLVRGCRRRPGSQPRQVTETRLTVTQAASTLVVITRKRGPRQRPLLERLGKALRKAIVGLAEEVRDLWISHVAWWRETWKTLLTSISIAVVAVALIGLFITGAIFLLERGEYLTQLKSVNEVAAEARTRRGSYLPGEAEKLGRQLEEQTSRGMLAAGDLEGLFALGGIERVSSGIQAWSKEASKFCQSTDTKLDGPEGFLGRLKNREASKLNSARITELSQHLQEAENEVGLLEAVVTQAERNSQEIVKVTQQISALKGFVKEEAVLAAQVKQAGADPSAILEGIHRLRARISTVALGASNPRPVIRAACDHLSTGLEKLKQEAEQMPRPVIAKPAPVIVEAVPVVKEPEPAPPPFPPPASIAPMSRPPIMPDPLPPAFVALKKKIKQVQKEAGEVKQLLEAALQDAGKNAPSDDQVLLRLAQMELEVSSEVQSLAEKLAAFDKDVKQMETLPRQWLPEEELKSLKQDWEGAKSAARDVENAQASLEDQLRDRGSRFIVDAERRASQAEQMVAAAKLWAAGQVALQAAAKAGLGQAVLLKEEVSSENAHDATWWKDNEDLMWEELKELKRDLLRLESRTVQPTSSNAAPDPQQVRDDLESADAVFTIIAKLPKSAVGAESAAAAHEKIKALRSELLLLPQQENLENLPVKKTLDEMRSDLTTMESILVRRWWGLRWIVFVQAIGIALPVVILIVLILCYIKSWSLKRVLGKLEGTAPESQRDAALAMLKETRKAFVLKPITKFLEQLTLRTAVDEKRILATREELERIDEAGYQQTIGELMAIVSDIRKRILHSS